MSNLNFGNAFPYCGALLSVDHQSPANGTIIHELNAGSTLPWPKGCVVERMAFWMQATSPAPGNVSINLNYFPAGIDGVTWDKNDTPPAAPETVICAAVGGVAINFNGFDSDPDSTTWNALAGVVMPGDTWLFEEILAANPGAFSYVVRLACIVWVPKGRIRGFDAALEFVPTQISAS